jgi:uncharacterized membrane protein YphA (DoxX/SURF4 family)
MYEKVISKITKHADLLSRIALFIVYFCFGILKIVGLSPASDLVKNLFFQMIPNGNFQLFYIYFSIFEVVIGILFLFPKLTKFATILFFIHIATTFMPLILLPGEIWSGFLVPSLEGQYTIKNLVLISLVVQLNKRKVVGL